jgi:uncharacterized integral membrane protein (TIGR00697 family)
MKNVLLKTASGTSTFSPEQQARRQYWLPILFGTLCGIYVWCNLNAGVMISPLHTSCKWLNNFITFTAADCFFFLIYVISDLLSACYGRRLSRRVTYVAMFVCFITTLVIWITGTPVAGLNLTNYNAAGTFTDYDNSLYSFRFAVASILALHFGDLVNDYVFVAIEKRAPDALFLQCWLSSLPGDIVDNITVNVVAWVVFGILFHKPIDWGQFAGMFSFTLLIKLAGEALLYPCLTRRLINYLGRE